MLFTNRNTQIPFKPPMYCILHFYNIFIEETGYKGEMGTWGGYREIWPGADTQPLLLFWWTFHESCQVSFCISHVNKLKLNNSIVYCICLKQLQLQLGKYFHFKKMQLRSNYKQQTNKKHAYVYSKLMSMAFTSWYNCGRVYDNISKIKKKVKFKKF